jgi:hypothetical protein
MDEGNERRSRFVENPKAADAARPPTGAGDRLRQSCGWRQAPDDDAGASASPPSRPDVPIAFCPEQLVILASVFVAGFQYHHGMHPKVSRRLEVGAALVPIRESGNPYDCWAVALYTWEGARLGYLPRGCNQPIAMMMDQGLSIQIAISSVAPQAEPWKKVRVTVWTALPGGSWFSTN